MIVNKSRKEYVINNAKYGVIKYIIQLVLQFFVRTIFIRILGENYLGLNSVFSSILGMLNIVELGMGTAIVYSMYKPIAENDIEKIKSLDTLYKKIYFVIAIIVTVIGLGIIPFLKYFITGSTAELNINFILIYILYLANSVTNYLSAHKRALLFAYQRNDIESKIKTITISILYLLQSISLIIFKNYYIYVILMPITTILDSLLVFIYSKKLFPEISGKSQKLDKSTETEIKKNVIAMSMHQISSTVVSSTDSILISMIISTAIAGIYSNYYTIIYTVTCVFTLLTTVLKSSVGNMLATSDINHSKQIFDNLNTLFSILAGFCSIALICLLQHFIPLWTGSVNYKLDFNIVLVLCIQFYLTIMRFNTVMFKDCAGLMWNDRWKPIIEASTNLIVSIILGKYLGLIGIFLGTIASTLIAPFWIEPHVLFKYYFKTPIKNYWKKYFINTVITLIIGSITYLLCSLLPTSGIIVFIVKMLICIFVPTILYLLFYFKSPELKYFITLLKTYINKNKKNHSKN